nr:cell division control protein 48 homolog C-like [Tanacetum cinerariifolium]
MLESKHVKRRRVEVKESESESDSEESDSSEEDRSAVSNSEDDEADYELKFEPEVDVTKEMLRKKSLGVRPMAGILLHGPPGCGKTKLAHAIANETGVPFYKISATELVSGISGKHDGARVRFPI